jgi:glycosyltransferase involved in cell wall biosynthesis
MTRSNGWRSAARCKWAVRIAYWTTACLEPRIEAVSKEVSDLASSFAGSRIFAVSPHLSLRVSRWGRIAGFHPRYAPLLRIAIPLIERAVDLNHIYAEVAPWLFFKALARRPIVLTIASEKGDPVAESLDRCEVIVTQTEGMRQRLAAAGLEPRRLRLIYPGIDVARFTPRASWTAPVRPSVLMATFPRTAEELESRGLALLIATARKYPHVDFSIVSRPWASGDTAYASVNELIRVHGVTNVAVLAGVQGQMEDLYRRHDFTVIPYTTPDGGKECPRSLIEGLACGVPTLISEVAPFASFVAGQDCGRIFRCTPEGFVDALERALAVYPLISSNATRVARANFDLRGTLREYGRIYDAFS